MSAKGQDKCLEAEEREEESGKYRIDCELDELEFVVERGQRPDSLIG